MADRRVYGRPGAPLGKRELQVALLVAQEKTNEQIAAEMFVARSTVHRQLKVIGQKLGARTKAGIVRELYEKGYLFTTPR